MRILLISTVFAPSVGGIETASRLLAEAFVQLGHEVDLLTLTPSAPHSFSLPYRVHRNPGWWRFAQLAWQADAIVSNGLTLRLEWLPLLMAKRPVTVVQVFLPQAAKGSLPQLLKRAWLRWMPSILPSRSLYEAYSARNRNAVIVPNPFDAKLFGSSPPTPKRAGVVFLGRLVPEKGGALFVNALAHLRQEGLTPRAAIIGDGPERHQLEMLVAQHGLQDQVIFHGTCQGTALVDELCRYRVLAVPSMWEEPFGIVALEGIAAGCIVVGTPGGGLADAIGPCGLISESRTPAAFATALARALSDQPLYESCQAAALTHLEQHHPAVVAAQYIRFIQGSQ